MRYPSEEDEQWVAEDLANCLPSEPPVRSSELVMPARHGIMRGSVWTPYGKRVDADGTCVILARNEHGYPTEFPLYEWGIMPLA